MAAYYNENEPYCVEWLKNLIKAGLIAAGDVDSRSILDVRGEDLKGYTQCHFFAGLGGWSGALRLGGWPDDRPAWTGSCPCQPFSLAGKQAGFADERHLWPVWRELVRECDPAVVFGEQVASASQWLGLVRSDMEEMGYAVGALPIQAASAGADHLRDRYWFVGHDTSESQGWKQRGGQQRGTGSDTPPCDSDGGMANSYGWRQQMESDGKGQSGSRRSGEDLEPARSDINHKFEWVIGADGKARRVKSGLRLLAHGVPSRVAKLRALGNAIDPRPAAAFIQAYRESVA